MRFQEPVVQVRRTFIAHREENISSSGWLERSDFRADSNSSISTPLPVSKLNMSSDYPTMRALNVSQATAPTPLSTDLSPFSSYPRMSFRSEGSEAYSDGNEANDEYISFE
jgi:hypothetical protein